MSGLFRRFATAVLAGMLFAAAGAAERWNLKYFYDEERSTLSITDLKFPSAERGVAVGYTLERDKTKPACLITSDGGAHWSPQAIKEIGLSLFFLKENLGWMVTPKGIWQTEEAGRNWHKLPKSPENMRRVYFLDEQHGWAVGAQKSVYETKDGGKSWDKVEAALEPKTNPKYTVYDVIAFATPEVGMINGWSRPPREDDQHLPDWMEPEKAMGRREWPHISISLDTRNGGKTWIPSTASMFGRITRVVISPNGPNLGLVEFTSGFIYPSEVFRFDWKTGKSTRIFREKNRAVTDIAVLPSGAVCLAAIEVPGTLQRSPIPGKLRMLRSDNLSIWSEMQVDYRAVAQRATLAGSPGGGTFVGTDTGMILKLEP